MIRRRYPAWARRRRRGAADPSAIEQCANAMAAGDRTGLRAVLRTDVVLIVDSGGQVSASSVPVEGRAAASDELLALMTGETAVAMVSINGGPGFVLVRDGTVVAVVTAETRSGLLSNIWVVCNPDKLRHWNRPSDG